MAQGYIVLETGDPPTQALLMFGYQTSDIASSGWPFVRKGVVFEVRPGEIPPLSYLDAGAPLSKC